MSEKLLKECITQLVKEALTSSQENRVGYLNAHIGSDYSYTDYLGVVYNPADDTVTVSVKESSPYGGMDYKGHGDVERESFSETVPAEPKAVLQVIKRAVNDPNFNFKKYGKATKKFNWNSRDIPSGLSLSNLAAALEVAKEMSSQ